MWPLTLGFFFLAGVVVIILWAAGVFDKKKNTAGGAGTTTPSPSPTPAPGPSTPPPVGPPPAGPSSGDGPGEDNDKTDTGKGGLSKGAWAGIGVAIAVVVLIILVVVFRDRIAGALASDYNDLSASQEGWDAKRNPKGLLFKLSPIKYARRVGTNLRKKGRDVSPSGLGISPDALSKELGFSGVDNQLPDASNPDFFGPRREATPQYGFQNAATV